MTIPRLHCRSFVHGMYIVPSVIAGDKLPPLIRQSGFFESWQISCAIVSDGSSPFLGLKQGSGWRYTFLQLLPNYADNEEINCCTDIEGGDEDDGKDIIVILPPTWALRALVVREDDMFGPGLYSHQYLKTLDGGQWDSQLLLPYHHD